jgi:hypothetical protein
MTEYALIAVVIGIAAMFLAARYGGALGGRYQSAHRQVEEVQTGDELAAGSAGSSPNSGAGSQVEARPFLVTDAKGNTRVDVGVAEFDLSTVIWLGIAVVVIGVVMTVQIFRAAGKGNKKQAPS